MRRQFRFGVLVALAVLILSLSVLAQQAQVQISSPEINQEIRGMVPIIGSASTNDFQYYKVEYGVGPNPSDWALIDRMFETPVINGQLVVWNTTTVPDGVYSLRLRAVKQDGNYDEFLLRGVIVANTRPTPAPTETPTPTETPAEGTPTATAVPGETPALTEEPRPTSASVQVITPSGPLTAPSPTPTVEPIAGTSISSLNTEGWGQSFMFGIAAMATVLAVVGLVFGVRHLL